MSVQFSCKDCTKRTSTCHTTCESYLSEVAKNDKEKELKKKYLDSLELHSNGTYYSGSRGYKRK